MSRASKLLKTYLEKASRGEDLSEAKIIITAMLPYFLVEEDFCKLPFEFVSSIFREYDEKFEKQDAMEFIENAAKYYQKNAVSFLSGIDCGHIGPDAAAAILQPLSCVPLIRELLKGTNLDDASSRVSNQNETENEQNTFHAESSQINESSNISSPKRASRKQSQADVLSESPKDSSILQNSSKINESSTITSSKINDSSSVASSRRSSKKQSQPPTQVELSQYSDLQSTEQQSSTFLQSNKEMPSSPEKRDKTSHSSHKSPSKSSKSHDQGNDIFSAISNKDIRSVEQIVANNPKVINERNQFNRTPLHFAVENEQLEMVQVLVDAGSDVNSTALNGLTPLFSAVALGNMDIVKYLVNNGADMSQRNQQNETVLHLAIKLGFIDLVKYFAAKGCDMTAKNLQGQTPIVVAKAYNKTEILMFIVSWFNSNK